MEVTMRETRGRRMIEVNLAFERERERRWIFEYMSNR